jgi:RNA polymerase sigma factor (sigma-70 family)
MPNRINEVVRHLRQTVLRHGQAELTDGQLLGHIVERRDEGAFAALLRRHGPMVWGVCRRVLRNHHDAEDAFQATCLVLIRKAASVRPREMVGNWLYGVAHQTALKARSMLAKRRTRESQMMDMPECEAPPEGAWRDLRPALDQALGHLPDKDRVAIILCDLEGNTRKQAARQLGLPEGTLAGRLTRGRALLARRLARHGPALSSGTLATVLSEEAATASVPPLIMGSTLKALTSIAAGQTAAASAVSANVAALTEGVLKSMFLTKLKTAALALVVCVLGTGLGVSSLAGQDQPAGAQPPSERRVGESARSPAAGAASSKEDKLQILERRLRDLERQNQALANELEALRNEQKPGAPPPTVKIEVQIIPLGNYMRADEVAKVLEKLFSLGGQRIVAFPSTNSIIVQGRPADIDAIASMVRRLRDHATQIRVEREESMRRAIRPAPPPANVKQ